MFGALLNGACIYPYDVQSQGLAAIGEWLAETQMTIYHSVPAIFRHALASKRDLPNLRLVRLEGDRATPPDVELFQERCAESCVLANGLGATECGIVRRLFVGSRERFAERLIPIGCSVEDMEVRIVGEGGTAVGDGQVGEIVVKSAYLSPGYWRRPELSAAAFQEDPEGSGQRLYRTGDLGRMRPNGCLEHLGRLDFRAKVRGQHVEVQAVEAALRGSDLVSDAVVATCQGRGGEPQLAAYIVGVSGRTRPSVGALRAVLEGVVPEHSIPTRYAFADELPLNANGKVDVQALPVPEAVRPELDVPFVRPRVVLEAQLSGLWEELLDVSPVGIEDDFRDLGGDSLLAAAVLAGIEELRGTVIPPPALIEAPTVARLAQIVRAHEAGEAPDEPYIEFNERGRRVPLFYFHGDYIGGALYTAQPARLLGPDQPLVAMSPHGVAGDPVPSTIEEMARDRLEQVRSLLPDGPYLISGHCQTGGLIAYELARQLLEAGEELALVALIGSTPPNVRARALRRTIDHVGSWLGLSDAARAEVFLGVRWLLVDSVRVAARMLRARSGPPQTGQPDARWAALSWAYSRAVLSYAPRRMPARLDLLWPEEDAPPHDRPPDERWRQLVEDVHVVRIPGDHVTSVTIHADAVAGVLSDLLRDRNRGDAAGSAPRRLIRS